jgi:DNA-directed RNA polymerase subunit RPC12/RpoP
MDEEKLKDIIIFDETLFNEGKNPYIFSGKVTKEKLNEIIKFFHEFKTKPQKLELVGKYMGIGVWKSAEKEAHCEHCGKIKTNKEKFHPISLEYAIGLGITEIYLCEDCAKEFTAELKRRFFSEESFKGEDFLLFFVPLLTYTWLNKNYRKI